MRTKTLILTAALSAAGLATSLAQTVYSVNAVGYVNKTIPPGFTMIANPLNAPTNRLSALLPAVPDGTQVFQWTGTTFSISLFEVDPLSGVGAWSQDLVLAPGGGAFVRNNTTTNLVFTFVGEVMQGNLTNGIGSGYRIVSSQVPQASDVVTLGFPAADGDQVYKWRNTGPSTGIYDIFLFEVDPLSGTGAWNPSAPVIDVGDSFFSRKNTSTSWTRTFSAN